MDLLGHLFAPHNERDVWDIAARATPVTHAASSAIAAPVGAVASVTAIAVAAETATTAAAAATAVAVAKAAFALATIVAALERR
jgi:hypothetical protein